MNFQRILITGALFLPGSLWLSYVADLSTFQHVGIVILLFVGGMIDGKFNW